MPIFSSQLSGSVYTHLTGTLSISGSYVGGLPSSTALQVTGSLNTTDNLRVGTDGYFGGSIQVAGNLIKDSAGNTALEFDGTGDLAVNGELTVNGNTLVKPLNGGYLSIDDADTDGNIQVHTNFVTITAAAGSTSTGEGAIYLKKSRGTQASPTSLNSGDNIGSITFQGYDDNFSNSAQILVKAAAAHGGDADDSPGKMEFWTTPDNSNVLTQAMTIESNQDITLEGDIQVKGNDIRDSGGSPALTFDGNQNVSLPKAGVVSLTIGTDADGNDRSILFNHATLKTRIGIDDNQDVFAINTDLNFEGTNDFEINHDGDVTIGNGTLIVSKLSGSTNQNLRIHSDADVIIQIDQEGDSTNKFQIQVDGDVSKFEVNEDGDVQMDGDLTVDGTGNSEFAGNLDIADRIRHLGDVNTQIRFPAADQVSIEANGIGMLLVDGASGQKEIAVNNSNQDHDFRVATDGNAIALLVEGSTGNVGVGVSPSTKLHIKGDLTVQDVAGSDIIGKLYASSDDGILDVYANNVVTNRIHGKGSSYFMGGNVGVGVTDPDHQVEILATSDQFKLSYDASKYTTFNVDSGGVLTVTPESGDVVIAGDSPKLTIGDGGAENTMLFFDGPVGGSVAGDWRFGWALASNELQIGPGVNVSSKLSTAIFTTGSYFNAPNGMPWGSAVKTNVLNGETVLNEWVCVAKTDPIAPSGANRGTTIAATFRVCFLGSDSPSPNAQEAWAGDMTLKVLWNVGSNIGAPYFDDPVGTSVVCDYFNYQRLDDTGTASAKNFLPSHDVQVAFFNDGLDNVIAQLWVRAQAASKDIFVTHLGGTGSEARKDDSNKTKPGWQVVQGDGINVATVGALPGYISTKAGKWASKVYHDVVISGSLITPVNGNATQQFNGFSFIWGGGTNTRFISTSDSNIEIEATNGSVGLGDISLQAAGGEIVMGNNTTDYITFNLDATPEIDITGAFKLDCTSTVEIESVGDMTLDASGDIILSADGDQIKMDDGQGSTRFTFNVDSTPSVAFTGDTKLDSSGTLEIESTGDMTFDPSGDFIIDDADLVLESASGTWCKQFLYTHDNGSNFYPLIMFRRSAGTKASPTIVADGDLLGTMIWQGYNGNGTDYDAACSINGYVNGTPGTGVDASDMPGMLQFNTSANGSSSPTARMTIDSEGNIGVGETDPPHRFNVVTTEATTPASYINNQSATGYGLKIRTGPDANPGNAVYYVIYEDGNGTDIGYLRGDGSGGIQLIDAFTGHHPSVMPSSDYAPGMIVESTGELWAHQPGVVSCAIPKVRLTTSDSSKTVFGVLSHTTGSYPGYEKAYGVGENETPVEVNGLGEGQVWVTDKDGEIENGDYIVSSVISGYGTKQADDILRSCTVAKCTEAVDWSTVTNTITYDGTEHKKYLIGCTYHSS